MPIRKQYVVVEGVVYTPPDPGDHVPDMGARPDQGLPGAQPHPEHPIYLPVLPPIDTGLHPEHPIYFPTPPLGIWGPNDPRPTPPIFIPVPKPPGDGPVHIWGGGNEPFPTPPIYLPVPTPPLGTWGGAGEPMPTPPIQLPPDFDGLTDEQKEALRGFLFGNLPPYNPDTVQPV